MNNLERREREVDQISAIEPDSAVMRTLRLPKTSRASAIVCCGYDDPLTTSQFLGELKLDVRRVLVPIRLSDRATATSSSKTVEFSDMNIGVGGLVILIILLLLFLT